MPAATAAMSPTDERWGGAEQAGDGRLVRPDDARASPQPPSRVKADSSIMPSMPMLTTPERSFMKPHRAPSAMGRGQDHDDGRDERQHLDEVATSWNARPMTGMSIQDVHQMLVLAAVRAGDRGLRRDAACAGRPDAEPLAQDDLGRQEEQDDALQHVDHLDRDAERRPASGRRPRAWRRRAAPRTGCPTGWARPSSATAMASKPSVGGVADGHVAGQAQDLDPAGEAGEQPGQGHGQDEQELGSHARVARGIRVGADGADLEAEWCVRYRSHQTTGTASSRDEDAEVAVAAEQDRQRRRCPRRDGPRE